VIWGKKGQVFEKEQLRMISYAGGIVFVAVFIVLVFAQGIRINVETDNLEQHIAAYRLLNSDNCLDISNGILDLDNFDELRLNNCFNSLNGVEIKLSYFNGSELGIIELNKKMVSQKIVCWLKESGYSCYDTRKFILISEGNLINKGILDMKVITNV
jgi:hypothetical protein